MELLRQHADYSTILASEASPDDLQRLLSVATKGDHPSNTTTTLSARETARTLLADLLLFLYRGETTKHSAEIRIKSLLVNLLTQGRSQQFLCFRLLLTMSLRDHHHRTTTDDDDSNDDNNTEDTAENTAEDTTVADSLFRITRNCVELLLDVRPRGNAETWMSATSCVIWCMSSNPCREDGQWMTPRLLAELIRRSQRTDAHEETMAFVELLSDRLCPAGCTTRDMKINLEVASSLLSHIFHESFQHEISLLVVDTMVLLHGGFPATIFEDRETLCTLLETATRVHPCYWLDHLSEKYGLKNKM